MGAGEDLERLRQELVAGNASDGQHTHAELYEFRALFHAHAVRAWRANGVPVVKSWRHHDGAECFGGDFFIVVAELPTGQVSNHYPTECWDLFDVPITERAPVHDGHTSRDVTARLRAALRRSDSTLEGGTR